jgi:hypothetical protein
MSEVKEFLESLHAFNKEQGRVEKATDLTFFCLPSDGPSLDDFMDYSAEEQIAYIDTDPAMAPFYQIFHDARIANLLLGTFNTVSAITSQDDVQAEYKIAFIQATLTTALKAINSAMRELEE